MKPMRRLICFVLLLALIGVPLVLALDTEETIQADLRYIEQMMEAATNGEESFATEGRAAEASWNEQIQAEGLDFEATAFFEDAESHEAVAVAIADYLIAHGITELNGEPFQLRVVASSKNLREGSSHEYARAGSIPHGTVVTILDINEDGWLRVTDGEFTGWCRPLHLAPYDGNQEMLLPIVEAIQAVIEAGQTITVPPQQPSSAPRPTTPTAPTAPAVPGGRDDDLYWLALTIHHEAGSDWLSDEHQLLVGNVVLNRVAHPDFPGTTIYDIVHQRGQYPWAGRPNQPTPSARAYANAQRLLSGERFMPANVVFQAEFRQGSGTHRTIHCNVLGSTTFFGYR